MVTPLYNKSPYIEGTLLSVLRQSCRNFELIVIDDGSTDNGPQIVEELARNDPRIRLVRQSNAGVSAARNRGIAEAIGEWVAFLDADDWWHPGYLETQQRAIEAYPQVDMVATMLRKIPDATDWSPWPWPEMSAQPVMDLIEDLPARWMQGIPFFTSSVAVRRSRLVNMQPCFKVGELHGEDLDLWFRVAEASAIAHSQSVLVAYRTAAGGSLTSQHAALVLAPFLLRMQDRARSGLMPSNKQRSALHFVAQQKVTLARQALVMGRRQEGLRWLWRARHAVRSKRWLMSLAMAVALPGGVVQRWEQWRNARTATD
nr:glycosyltransferase family A protein [uncultured Albidiferax sp.]